MRKVVLVWTFKRLAVIKSDLCCLQMTFPAFHLISSDLRYPVTPKVLTNLIEWGFKIWT